VLLVRNNRGGNKKVHREITPIFDSRKVVLQQSQRSITPFGGISVFFEYLGKLGYAQKIAEHMPFQLKSPNAIDPARTFTAFIVSVLVGARRFAHTGLFRIDKTLHTLMGIVRFPNDDTIRNLFKRFTEAHVYSFYDPLWRWMLERVPQRSEGYTLDLDSTVFERYGKQQGALKGYNPKKRGRAESPSFNSGIGGGPFRSARVVAEWQLCLGTRGGGVSEGGGSASGGST
jgi:hypothetical protein